MPDRLRARAALVAALLLLTIAGIRTVGPAVSLDVRARSVVITVGCVLEVVLLALLIALRWRRADAVGLAARLRPMLTRILAAGLIAIPVAIVIGSLSLPRRLKAVEQRPDLSGRRPPQLRPGRHGHGSVSIAVFHDIFIAILIAALIIAAIVIWRHRRWRLVHLDAGLDGDEIADTPAELARAVDSGRQALGELDDARAAIIRCYRAMEDSLAEVGAVRSAAETPDELLARAAAAALVSPDPAGRLTALFYEARFSTHPMPASRRNEAAQALTELAATLPAGLAT